MNSSHAIAIPRRRKQAQPGHEHSVTALSLSPSPSSSTSHASSMATSAPQAHPHAVTTLASVPSTGPNAIPILPSTPTSTGRNYGYSARRLSMGYRHGRASSTSAGNGTGVGEAVYGHERRPSLLSSSISKSEHTVINIGDSESPRLITCIKASQGFDWNQDLFLPSYADYDGIDLETRQDPVEDIVLTEEEIEAMFPR